MERLHRAPLLMMAALLPLHLVGCGSESEEGQRTGANAATSAPAASEGPDSTRMYMIRLDGQRRPDLVGSSGFVPRGERTQVVAGIRGAPAGTTLQGHIHQGDTCDAPGDPVTPLGSIRVGNEGIGRSTITIPLTIGSVFDGNHLVIFHAEGRDSGPAIICGDIPVLIPLMEPSTPSGG